MEIGVIIEKLIDLSDSVAASWNDDTGKKVNEKILYLLELIKKIEEDSLEFSEIINTSFSMYPEEEIEVYYKNLLLLLNEDI